MELNIGIFEVELNTAAVSFAETEDGFSINKGDISFKISAIEEDGGDGGDGGAIQIEGPDCIFNLKGSFKRKRVELHETQISVSVDGIYTCIHIDDTKITKIILGTDFIVHPKCKLTFESTGPTTWLIKPGDKQDRPPATVLMGKDQTLQIGAIRMKAKPIQLTVLEHSWDVDYDGRHISLRK